jgi:two-component system, NarL family, nitrate/nitrite response regulator NarL
VCGAGVDLRVVVVADDPLVRAGLATLLASQPGCMVVGQVASEAEILRELDVYRPDVVVWDLGWEPMHTITTPPYAAAAGREGERSTRLERLAELRDAGYPMVVLISSDLQAAAAWAAGARGLLLREVPAETLVASLQAVAQGLVVWDQALAATLLPPTRGEPAPPPEPLTPRELEVLQLVAEGLPNKTIADRLHISEHTVKFHMNALMGKLGAQSRTEAVVRATRLGILLL